jgi:hypothetical protein
MFKYLVKSESTEFGLFKTLDAAQLFIDALNLKFNHMDDYWIEEVK